MLVPGCRFAALIATTLQLVACSSVVEQLPPGFRISSAYRDVSALLDKHDYLKARERLDNEGVGQNLNSEKLRDRDLAAARAEFEKRITARYLEEHKEAFGSGKARLAATKVAIGLQHCSWCADLRQTAEHTQSAISRIDAFGSNLQQISSMVATGDMSSHRAVLRQAVPDRALLKDSPQIESALSKVESALGKHWAVRIQRRDLQPTHLREFRADLTLIGVDQEGQRRLESQTRLLMISGPKVVDDKKNRDALLALARSRMPTYPASARELRDTVESHLRSEVGEALGRKLDRGDVDYPSLAFAEELLALASTTPDERRAIAKGHLNRAGRLAGSGRSSVLALIHAERVMQLNSSKVDPDAAKVRTTATAAFAAAGRLPLRLKITTNPGDDPDVQDLVRFAVLRAVRQQVRPHIYIQHVSIYQKATDIDIQVNSAKLFVPSTSDLKAQSSTYLSHYEDVPNPRKAALRSQVDFQRITVSNALSNLNSQISIFNINPTQFGLQMVNSARTTYSSAVDHYNFLVDLYNATPSTISRPVFLPYVFREGTVRHGWQMSGVAKVSGIQAGFDISEVDSDFVRIGTRPNDQNVNYRRDDLIDIPVGTDRLHEQLVKAAAAIQQKLANVIDRVEIDVRAELSVDEEALVRAALYPFKERHSQSASVPNWAKDILHQLQLPLVSEVKPPALKISAPSSAPTNATPQEIAAHYGSAVAYITSRDGGIGSGALISADGLVLTAAHVLRAAPFEVSFPRSGDTRRWPAELIFANDAHDVAVLRIKDYRATRWFEVSFAEPAIAGEPVVALGNPHLQGSGTAIGSISDGIIAKPYDRDSTDGVAGLVANIAVASGSSGGPLVSRRSGKIVGVVTAVVSPSIKENFASSGYWAVAAPTTEFRGWLGLTY